MKKMDGEEFDQLVRFFDGMATTDWLSEIHEKLKEATGNWDQKHVLDVGCGTGRFLLRGAGQASHVTGIDLSSEMIKASQKLFLDNDAAKNASFLVGDACYLPFEDHKFDIAVSLCVLFLLPEPKMAMDELVRVTKKDGIIALLNPTLKMSQQEAERYCQENEISGFEQKTLLQWSTISTSRHRYSTEQLTSYFTEQGAREIENIDMLENLAIITIVKF